MSTIVVNTLPSKPNAPPFKILILEVCVAVHIEVLVSIPLTCTPHILPCAKFQRECIPHTPQRLSFFKAYTDANAPYRNRFTTARTVKPEFNECANANSTEFIYHIISPSLHRSSVQPNCISGQGTHTHRLDHGLVAAQEQV